MTSLADVARMTDTEGATIAYSKAVDRLRRLETEAAATFAEYDQARERMTKVGINADVTLTPGISAAFSSWKQNRAAAEGRDTVRHDDEQHGWPLRQDVA